MLYRKNDDKKIREIELPERVTLEDRDSFFHIIDDFINSKNETLSLNFEKTVMVDSSGYGFLLIASEACTSKKKKLVIKNMTGKTKVNFEIMNFDKMLSIIKGS